MVFRGNSKMSPKKCERGALALRAAMASLESPYVIQRIIAVESNSYKISDFDMRRVSPSGFGQHVHAVPRAMWKEDKEVSKSSRRSS